MNSPLLIRSVKDFFVGRAHELQILHEKFTSVIQLRQPTIVFIKGDFGVGKTALAEKLIDEVLAKKAGVLVGRGLCSKEKDGNGFVPFNQLLSSLGEQAIKHGIILGDKIEFIKKIAPVWMDIFTAGIASATVKTIAAATTTYSEGSRLIGEKSYSRDSVFTQFIKILERLSQNQPVIALIEDIHWIDLSSLDLIFHIARNLHDRRIFWIFTYRPVEATTNNPNASEFQEIRANLLGHGLAQEIDLTAVAGIDVDNYINKCYPRNGFSTDFVNLIQKTTEGHPLFVAQLFLHLEETKTILPIPTQDGDVMWMLDLTIDVSSELPNGLKNLLRLRVKNLEENLRQDLIIASVEGEDFTIQVLSRLKDVDNELKIIEQLESLDKEYLLIFENGSKKVGSVTLDFYKFAHRFIREFVYEEKEFLSDHKKRLLHKRVGECLELLYKDRKAISGQLANHFYNSHEYLKAAQYTLAAGQLERSRFSLNEGIRWCNSGLDWLSILDHDTQKTSSIYRLRVELLEELSIAFQYMGIYSEAEISCKKALDQAKVLLAIDLTMENILLFSRIATVLSDIYDFEGKDEECIPLLEDAMALLENNNVPFGEVQFEVESLLYFMYGMKGENKLLHIQNLRDSITKSNILPETEKLLMIRASTYNLLGVLISDSGYYKESIAIFRAAFELATQTQNKWLTEMSLINLADDYVRCYQLKEGEEYNNKALEISTEIGDIDSISIAHTIKGDILLNLKEYENAEREFKKAISYAKEANAEHYQCHMYAGLALCSLAISPSKNDAFDSARMSVELAERAEDSAELVYSLDTLAIVFAAQGNTSQAREYFVRAINIHSPEEQIPFGARAQLHLGNLLIATGDVREAISLLEGSLAVFEKFSLIYDIENVRVILDKYKMT